MTVLYITHPASLRHDPQALSPGHPDDPRRLEAIESAIADAHLEGLRRLAAPAATEAELELVHSDRHVAFIRDLCAAGGGAIDAHLLERHVAIVEREDHRERRGAALDALELEDRGRARERGFRSGNRPPPCGALLPATREAVIDLDVFEFQNDQRLAA